MRKLWIALAVLAALGLIVVLSLRAGGGRKSTRVYVDEARSESIVQAVKATGEVRPRIEVNISTHVVAKIARLHVKEGDAIAAGAPFLDLERDAFLAVRDNAAAQLAISRTELRQTEVSLADAEIRATRARRIAEEGISSPEQLEASILQQRSAALRVEQASSSVEQARASLTKAQDDLGKTTIFAPISGRVIRLNAKEGEVVVSGTMNNPASVIGTIADLAEVLVEADVDENEVVHVREGQPAIVRVDALSDHRFDSKVVEIGSSGYTRPQQPDVTYFKVKVLLIKPDERLRAGMSARVEVEVDRKSSALVVPIQSVVDRPPAKTEEETAEGGGGKRSSATADKAESGSAREDEVSVVFVVESGVARQRAVATGISDATRVEIRSGLSGGEKVASGPYRSLKKLRDGDRVKVVSRLDEEPKAGKSAANEEKD